MSNFKGYEMIITVKARVSVFGKESEYWEGLSELQRGKQLGMVQAEVERYFSDELDAGDVREIDVDVVVEKIE